MAVLQILILKLKLKSKVHWCETLSANFEVPTKGNIIPTTDFKYPNWRIEINVILKSGTDPLEIDITLSIHPPSSWAEQLVISAVKTIKEIVLLSDTGQFEIVMKIYRE